jgi:hypothetical protein
MLFAEASALSVLGFSSIKLLDGPKMNSLVKVALKVCVSQDAAAAGRGNEIGEKGNSDRRKNAIREQSPSSLLYNAPRAACGL